MKLLIPSAKLVPEELQSVGKLPAIIYPVNQKIVFEYLYEQYKDICDSVKVTCFENAKEVHSQLAKYANKIEIEDLDALGDLGYTVSYAIGDAQGPGIVNFADTIVMDAITNCGEDAFFYAEDHISDTWTYFEEENGVIGTITDKQQSHSNEMGKLFVGVFRFSRLEYFQECLREALANPNPAVSSFYWALQAYSRRYPVQPVRTDNWFDIGHADRYYSSQLEVKAREFNHITIDKNRGILRKTSEDVDKFIGEIKWYLKLPADIEYIRPRIFRYSLEYRAPYVEMEYYAYHTVHEMFLYADLTAGQWTSLFERIRFACDDLKRYSLRDDKIVPALEEMYLTKTVQRLEKLKKDERFSAFFHAPVRVNGTVYKPLDEICGILRTEIPAYLYDVEAFNIIHGDLCFTNIMVDSNFTFIKVIDPRGKFGPFDIYGDFRYELAKLFHSVDGKYDFIIKDLFDLEYDLPAAQIHFGIRDRKRPYDLYQLFTGVFRAEIGEDLKKIELIEALLFLSMIVLHGESLEHQLAMLGTGLEILDRVMDIRQ